MKKERYKAIKEEYDNFYKALLRRGKLPLRSTELGFWNSAISDEVYRAFKILKLQNFKSFIDLGSGDGKIALIAALFCKMAEGVEIDEELHSKALKVQNKLQIKNALFHNHDFFDHNISPYDIVFINPDAPMERGVEKKLLQELKGKLIVWGHHFHPTQFKERESFLVENTKVTLYSTK
jgi:protein-L-isoaspartate O-methyltransferase